MFFPALGHFHLLVVLIEVISRNIYIYIPVNDGFSLFTPILPFLSSSVDRPFRITNIFAVVLRVSGSLAPIMPQVLASLNLTVTSPLLKNKRKE